MDFIKRLSQADISSIFSKEGEVNASGAFTRLRLGQGPTPRTPLYKNIPQDIVLQMWVDILNRMKDDSHYGPVDAGYIGALVEYDLSRSVKFGPQGELRPLAERAEDLEGYYQNNHFHGFDLIDEECIEKVARTIFGDSLAQLRPLSLSNVIKRDRYDDKLDTNSGCPDFTKRSGAQATNNAIRDAESGKWRHYPMGLGSRSQRGSERFIFMAPFSMNLIEKTYLYPMLDMVNKLEVLELSAWRGFPAVEQGFAKMGFFREDKAYMQIDYTKMDKYFNFTCNSIVTKVVEKGFQPRYSEEITEVLNHYMEVPILIQIDKMIVDPKGHGMPSGSGFTNFSETLVSLYLYYLLQKLDPSYGIENCQCLGDDMVISFDREIFDQNREGFNTIAKYIRDTAKLNLGLLMSAEKQRVDSITTVYLQRFFDERIRDAEGVVVGCYPSILALNTAVNPERYHDPRKWSKEMEILRWLMILENCNKLPYFSELVKFFIKGDKYKLGLLIPGFFDSLTAIYEEGKAIKGFVPSYNNDFQDRGIMDFIVVKYLIQNRSVLENE